MEITEIIKKKYSSLPFENRMAMLSEEVGEIVVNTAKKESLSGDQVDGILEIVGLILLQELPLNQLLEEINKIGIPDQSAQEICKNLDERIFSNLSTFSKPKETPPQEITAEIKGEESQNLPTSTNKPLLDHIKAFEERKKQKQEEIGNTPSADVPPNLPTEIGDANVGQTEDVVEEKKRPAGPDPYHEPIA